MLSLIRPRLGGGMLFGATLAAAVLGLVLASCGETDATVLRIGAVHPLTGEGNVYGLPVKRVIERAVADVNAAWDQRAKSSRLSSRMENAAPKMRWPPLANWCRTRVYA